MITPTEIQVHLNTYLPRVTTLFNDVLSVSSASVTAPTIIEVTSASHGLSVGNSVILAGGTVENAIASAVLDASGDNVVLTTVNEHDFNAPPLPEIVNVTLSGFTNPAYNVSHQIVDIPNRNKITIALPTGETVAPTLNGNEVAVEDRSAGIKGLYSISAVTTNTFEVETTDVPPLPVGPINNIRVLTSTRIAVATDITRARELYTQQASSDKLWAFIIMEDVDVSRDRFTLNDAVAGFTNQDEALLRLLHNFSIAVFFPISDTTTPVDAQDLAYGDVFTALLNVMYGFNNSTSRINYTTVPSGHGTTNGDNSSFYEHVYSWQMPIAINKDDGFFGSRDVAARDINAVFDLFGDAEAPMELNINLDEEP